ncbi:class I alpha-mannosidase 1A [Aspergillus aculeatinus CBS 121060]|uniref:Class I alpha-mannosidase 1A n=1 Tax=Aspergillus aculeatinus CBS 121060 TaxID=1448322 RepID=A0ACD1HFJ1_9EURO|nr:class I alpha-mannosidase 1A [Aspergillus aculeatinus CBS 121060]RAH72242.1 class I alpha-mannosidase 1A [Aspergillus aculeatinus CBS 121060]
MMFRARRYRVLLVFAAIFVLALVHFAGSREQSSASWRASPPADRRPGASAPNPPAVPEQAAPQSPASPPSAHDYNPEQFSTEESKDTSPDVAVEGPPSTSAESPQPSEEPATEKDGDNRKTTGLGAPVKGQGKLGVETPAATWTRPHWQKLPELFPIRSEDMIQLPSGQPKPIPKLQADFKDETSADKMTRLERLSEIKEVFERAWTGYKTSAMGHDEIKPLRGGFRDPFNGWGATLVDSLDTLWLMDLKEEFSIAVDYVKTIDFTTTSKRNEIPLFETVIRYLGGLISAYDVSGHKYDVLLAKAVELAEILMGAFDTPNRMPSLMYKWTPSHLTRPHHADKKAILAELGSLSVEFTRLAQLTKENKYYDAVARITNELEKLQDQTQYPGLWPVKLDASGCRKNANANANANINANTKELTKARLEQEYARDRLPVTTTSAHSSKPHPTKPAPTDAKSYQDYFKPRDARSLHEDAQLAEYPGAVAQGPGGAALSAPEAQCTGGLDTATIDKEKYSLGALADSTYEYLPKEYMLLGGLNDQYRSMYEKAMNTIRQHLVFQPMIKGGWDVRFLSTAIIPKNKPGPTVMEYKGDHLSCFLGGMVGIGAKLFGLEGDMDLAKQLTDGCVWAYQSTKSGIMPEEFSLVPCKKGQPCEWDESTYHTALDPDMLERFAKAQERKEQKEKEEAAAAMQAEAEVADLKKKKTLLGKRERGNWHVIGLEDEATPKKPEPEQPPEEEEEKVPSHEEYVATRISNERLPPGVTKLINRKYLLRPEAIESVFIMYRLTGDESWRKKGWEMFQAVSKYTRTEFANSAIDDVTVTTPEMLDEMQSFWLAETLKYFYLLFSDPTVVSLDDYVLNTEAHPLRRPN